MTGEDNRSEEVDEEIRTMKETEEEAAKARKTIKNQIQQQRVICANLTTIEETCATKRYMLSQFNPYSNDLDDLSWGQSSATFRTDESRLSSLKALNKEIETKVNPTVMEWATTSCSGQISTASSTVSLLNNYQPYVPPVIIKDVQKRIQDMTPNYIHEIIEELKKNYPSEASSTFQGISQKWDSANATDKPSIINELRNFIFDGVMKEFDHLSEGYTKIKWYIRYKDKPNKEQFTRTRFFILGYRQESTLTNYSLIEIDTLSEDLANCYHEMSVIGHEGKGQESNINATYKRAIASLSACLLMRCNFHSKTP